MGGNTVNGTEGLPPSNVWKAEEPDQSAARESYDVVAESRQSVGLQIGLSCNFRAVFCELMWRTAPKRGLESPTERRRQAARNRLRSLETPRSPLLERELPLAELGRLAA